MLLDTLLLAALAVFFAGRLLALPRREREEPLEPEPIEDERPVYPGN